MEKYSKWRDPATGIQPFLPPVPPNSVSPIFLAVLAPFSAIHALARILLLAAVAALYTALDLISFVLAPLPPLHRTVRRAFAYVTGRLALGIMGYWWIEREIASSKRGKQGVLQIANRSPQRGDLIISNYTSYIDILLLNTFYNPTFLLPIFSSLPTLPDTPGTLPGAPKPGRATGTGSANLSSLQTLPQPPLLGYMPISFWSLVARTGTLPPTADVPPVGMYKTLKEARRREKRPVALLPEGTTGNGRAILRFGEGVLAEGDVGGDQDGQVWIKYIRHTAPTPFAATATCPTPTPLSHFLKFLYTPTPFPSRGMTERTLHPSASPSSPSFLPSEILANTPGGLESAGKDGKGAWREACAIVLAETGRIRRVRLGWVEKEGFLQFWERRR